ncbi:MAG: hypothetical protein ACOVT5_00100, partial [Armatimonadaceae bacterium]
MGSLNLPAWLAEKQRPDDGLPDRLSPPIRPSPWRIRPYFCPIRPCPCPIRPNLVFAIDGCTAFVRMLSLRCQRLLDFVTPIATRKECQ